MLYNNRELVDAVWALSVETAEVLRPQTNELHYSVWSSGTVHTMGTLDGRRFKHERPVPGDACTILERLAAHHHRHVTPTLVKVGDWFATLTETQDDGTETVVATGQGRTALIAALSLALALDTQSPGWQVLPAARSDRVTTPETRPPLSGASDGGTPEA